MYREILALASLILCLSLMTTLVEGYNPTYTIVAVAGSTPNIDGTIATGEWDDASTVSFNDTVVYVKQDGKDLYAALNISDTTISQTMPQDVAALFIDVNNDGGTSPQPDDILFGIFRSGTLYERQGTGNPVTPTGWNASASSTSKYWQAEFNITFTKIQITPGAPKTLGIAIESYNYEETSYPYFWPPMTAMQSNSPYNWGNLGSQENWVPEFPSAIILPLFIIFTLVAIVFATKKTSRKTKT